MQLCFNFVSLFSRCFSFSFLSLQSFSFLKGITAVFELPASMQFGLNPQLGDMFRGVLSGGAAAGGLAALGAPSRRGEETTVGADTTMGFGGAPLELPDELPLDVGEFAPPELPAIEEFGVAPFGAPEEEEIFRGLEAEEALEKEGAEGEARPAVVERDWSGRTQKLKVFLDTQPERFSFDDLVENKSKRTCVRVFYEMLVLKSHGFIDVEQTEPYGDILVEKTERFDEEALGHSESEQSVVG